MTAHSEVARMANEAKLTYLQLRHPVQFAHAPETSFRVGLNGNADAIVPARLQGGAIVPCEANARPDGFLVTRRPRAPGAPESRALVWGANVLAVQ